MKTFIYFAYGSNMLSHRLAARCPSARPVGVARAVGHALHFAKKSETGGKATMIEMPRGATYGVLYEIAASELAALDIAEVEGRGYRRHDVFPIHRLTAKDGVEQKEAVTYMAQAEYIDHAMRPMDWYLALVLAGAQEHGLPAPYIDGLKKWRCSPTQDPDCRERQKAFAALKKTAGTDWKELIGGAR